MSSQSVIVAQLESQRRSWLDMPAGEGLQQPPAGVIRMQIDTPSQFQASRIINALRSNEGDALTELVAPLVKAWENVTDAFILGPGVGADEPAECGPRLVALMLGDRPEWVMTLAMKALEAATVARKKVVSASGN